ncbi:ABC transporter permease [Agrobacterium sp. ES01]|uniref:ABC transporter permease n=1 Tax=Agrobacterium sp. ES01 TaxID=3420714 RepID=UPI003D1453A3
MLLLKHLRIVSALLIREMASRFGDKPGGYVWAFLEPGGYVMMMTVVFQAITHSPALGNSFPLFFASGYMAFYFYNATLNYVGGALAGNRALLNYPTLAPIDTVVSRFLLQMFTNCFVAILVFFLIIHFEMKRPPNLNWAPLLEAGALASFLALGVGMSNTVLFLRFPFYESVYGIISRPLMLISGVFFIPDNLPHPYRDFVLINPVSHVIILFRKGFYPEYRATGLDMGYLYAFVLASLLSGTMLFFLAAKTLRNQ